MLLPKIIKTAWKKQIQFPILEMHSILPENSCCYPPCSLSSSYTSDTQQTPVTSSQSRHAPHMYSGHAADLWQVAHRGLRRAAPRPEIWPLVMGLWGEVRVWGAKPLCTAVNWLDPPLGLTWCKLPSPSLPPLPSSKLTLLPRLLGDERGAGVRWYRWGGLLSAYMVDVRRNMIVSGCYR